MTINKTNFFVKILLRIANAISSSDTDVIINDNQLAIMNMLYNNTGNKLSTKESILLFEKVQESFHKEMKNREIAAKNEIETISEYKEKYQLSFA